MKRFGLLSISCIVSLLIAECLLWLLGFRPHEHNDYRIESEPAQFIVADERYGFGLNPGAYLVDINNGLQFTVTHDKTGSRKVFEKADSAKVDVSVYGCSFAYGLGISDGEDFVNLLAQKFPAGRFKNQAVPGYGTVQAWLQWNDALRLGDTADVLILCYADFHDERNAMSLGQRARWQEAFYNRDGQAKDLLQKARFPFFDPDQSAVEWIEMKDLYAPLPLSDQFALIELLDQHRQKRSDEHAENRASSLKLFERFRNKAEKLDLRLIVAGINLNTDTQDMLNELKQGGLNTFMIGVDISDSRYNFLPWDAHPNEAANLVFAARLDSFLGRSKLIH